MSKKSDPTHPALQPLHPDLFVKVEYVPVGGLTPYKGNPRTHSKRQIEQIMHSIAFFGFASPLVANAAGVLIQGEGRRRAAPKYTQFKPARSGNPGGRKKGSRNFSTLLKEAAQSTILVNDSGRFREVAMVEAVVLRGLQMGLGGNTRAMAIMLQQFERHLVNAEDNGTELPEEDQASWSGASFDDRIWAMGAHNATDASELIILAFASTDSVTSGPVRAHPEAEAWTNEPTTGLRTSGGRHVCTL